MVRRWCGLALVFVWFVAGVVAAAHSDIDAQMWTCMRSDTEYPTAWFAQVVSPYFSEKVAAIRVGDMKLVVGAPGDGRTLCWPELLPVGSPAVPFGASGGSRRDGNTSCLAGIVAGGLRDTTEKCRPGCLFNVTADAGETVNLFDRLGDVAAALAARLKEVGDAAPPQSSYWADPAVPLAAICQSQDATGWLEPLGSIAH
jgi:hypothetical protein